MTLTRNQLIIVSSVGGVLIIGLLIFLLLRGFGSSINPPKSATLQFWSVFDESSYYTQAIREYSKQNPGINIVYRKFSFADYEKSLIDAFASGTGPDIWLMHNTWLPKHGDKIQPLPQTVEGQKQPLFTVKDFHDQFVDVAASDLIYNNQIYGLPLYVDTLALYYNKNLLNTAGIASPPATWEEFNQAVEKLTQFDNQNNIIRSGAAIGTAKNVNRSTDILTLLFLQSGVEMTDNDNATATFASPVGGSNVGEIGLQYYTDFANPTKQVYTWNDQSHYSIDSFVEGQTAMMFNYSHQILTLRSIAPRFNFSVTSMPQLNQNGPAVNYANYWAPTVSKQSVNGLEAWKFLIYLTSAQGATGYLNASGRPAARRDLIEFQQNESDLGVFASQALSARSWYQIDNSAIETIFAEMIDDVNFGRASVTDALRSAESQVNVLMQKNLR